MTGRPPHMAGADGVLPRAEHHLHHRQLHPYRVGQSATTLNLSDFDIPSSPFYGSFAVSLDPHTRRFPQAGAPFEAACDLTQSFCTYDPAEPSSVQAMCLELCQHC